MTLHSDLPDATNEHFDRLMRDPDEFRTWVHLVMSRCAPSPALAVEAGEAIAAALFTFIVKVLDVEDEDIVALDRTLDAAVTELGTVGLTTGMLRKGDGHGYDVRSFWDYATQRAVEDSVEASTPGPEHPAEPEQHNVGGRIFG